MTTEVPWTEEDTQRAVAFWEEYQKTHDITPYLGQTAGIDPKTGRVWFGKSAQDIWRQQDREGTPVPFYSVCVGKTYYRRKGWGGAARRSH